MELATKDVHGGEALWSATRKTCRATRNQYTPFRPFVGECPVEELARQRTATHFLFNAEPEQAAEVTQCQFMKKTPEL